MVDIQKVAADAAAGMKAEGVKVATSVNEAEAKAGDAIAGLQADVAQAKAGSPGFVRRNFFVFVGMAAAAAGP